MSALMQHSGIYQCRTIPADRIPFADWVVAACRENRCGRYATCWTCPPGVGEPEELKKKICSYRYATVFSCRYDLEDSFDVDGMREGQHSAKAVLQEICSDLRREGISFFALGCEGCGLCPSCSYPDAPCRHPDLAIPSVEACGINVMELARRADIRYCNGENTVTYFCMILSDQALAEETEGL